MKHIAVLALSGLVLGMGLSACGGGDDPPPPSGPGLQSLQIVNKGIVLTPGTTTTDYAPNRIHYQALIANFPPEQFTAVLSAEDFARLAALVDSRDLVRVLGQPNAIHAPCRHNGYQIAITKDNLEYRFDIPGSQTCGAALVPALGALLELSGELVIKYTPPRPG